MERYNWDILNKQQLGAYAEYFVKMELTMRGFQVYAAEVDDRGIDFVARKDKGQYIEFQVKSLRDTGYVFIRKKHFSLSETLVLAFVRFLEGKSPELYLIPSKVWENPNGVFVSRDYGGDLSSEPEWGLNVSQKNINALEQFRFESMLTSL